MDLDCATQDPDLVCVTMVRTFLDKDVKRGLPDLYLGHSTLDPDLLACNIGCGCVSDPDLKFATMDPDPGDSGTRTRNV